jgi:hypothetical protein
MWQIVNCKNGISSYEVHRALGITQKSAWFLDHRIRLVLTMGTINKFSGQIEADETFIGGKARNMYVAKREQRVTGTGGKDKTAVLGILERGGKVRTKVVENTKKKTLQNEVRSSHKRSGEPLESFEARTERHLCFGRCRSTCSATWMSRDFATTTAR